MRPSFLRWLAAFSPASPTASSPAQRVQEQIEPTAMSSSPTEEDWYWGRLVTGTEEDYYWRRLSDNWFEKDVIPVTF